MFTVLVRAEVRPDKLERFEAGILANAAASLADEPGCLRFDVHRAEDDPCTFYFHEIYTSRDSFLVDHRSAPHYQAWRRVVEECVLPGTQQNTFAVPLLPEPVPDRPQETTP